jgi:hypothetical protein
MRKDRHSLPVSQPGATEFSDDRETMNQSWVITALKAQPQFLRRLEREAQSLAVNYARKREPGSWALAYLAFVSSGDPDIEPWWRDTHAELWRAAGFTGRPPYERVWTRFTELEQCAEAFQDAAGRMMRHAREQDDRVGKDVHVDSTAAETHARLVHDCRPGDGCPGYGKKGARGTGEPKREASKALAKEREDMADQELDEDATDELLVGDAEEVELDDEDRIRRIRIGAHWFKLLDPTAGVRAYTGKKGTRKFWAGFYNTKAVDHFTGGVLAVHVSSASIQEYHSYDPLLDRVLEVCGATPRAIMADKGYSVKQVYKRNTELGIASVIAWRPTLNEPQRVDRPEIDRHGIPRCKHCKGPTRFIRFCETPKPRLWYRCELGTFADCRKPSPQSRLCETDWKSLLPMWRTSEVYLALRNAGKHHEAPHQYWRSRYGVAGDSTDTRPKRRGIGWQQLRSNAALVVEWLRILHRMGWLGSARRVKRGLVATDGKAARDRLLTHRAGLGLNRPYSFTPDGAVLADPPGAPPGTGPPTLGIADPDAEDIPF